MLAGFYRFIMLPLMMIGFVGFFIFTAMFSGWAHAHNHLLKTFYAKEEDDE